MNWLGLVEGIAQVALNVNPKTASLAPFVHTGIVIAQQAHDAAKAAGQPLTGAQRLAVARAEILNGVSAAASTAPDRFDPALVDDTFMHIVSDIVDASKIVGQAKEGNIPHAAPLGEGYVLPVGLNPAPNVNGGTSTIGQGQTVQQGDRDPNPLASDVADTGGQAGAEDQAHVNASADDSGTRVASPDSH